MKKILLGFLFLASICNAQNSSEISRIINGISNDLPVIGAASQSVLNNNICLATAGSSSFNRISGGVISYRSFYIQIVGSAGISAGQVTIEGSNDNVTFTTLIYYDENTLVTGAQVAPIAITASSNKYYSGKMTFQYFRCRISTAFTGGTVQAFTSYSTQEYVSRMLSVFQTNSSSLSNTAFQGATWTVQPGNTPNITPWFVALGTNTTNSSTSSSFNSAATTNATSLKATAGLVYSVSAMNTSAAVKYIRIFNKASAPTLGTDVPIMVIAVPAGASKEIPIGVGLKLSTGIAFAITNAAPVLDATAVAAGDVQLLINWN